MNDSNESTFHRRLYARNQITQEEGHLPGITLNVRRLSTAPSYEDRTEMKTILVYLGWEIVPEGRYHQVEMERHAARSQLQTQIFLGDEMACHIIVQEISLSRVVQVRCVGNCEQNETRMRMREERILTLYIQ